VAKNLVDQRLIPLGIAGMFARRLLLRGGKLRADA